jgi:ATP/maltotriose-dependent transcriptional regulator MalT
MVEFDAAKFHTAVRDALEHLWIPSHLKRSPLLDLEIVRWRAEQRVRAVTPTHLIQALQDTIREAIDTLKPQDEQEQPTSRRWYPYCLLHYRYWEELAADVIASKLYISRRTLYRELSEAIGQLTEVLHHMENEVEDQVLAVAKWAEAIPRLRNFCGRVQELAGYRDRWDAHHLIVIEGLAGIGKTSLGAELARQYAGETPVFWYTFRQGLNDDVNSVLWALAAFLARQGNSRLWRFLKLSGEEITPRPASLKISYLLSSLETGQYVLCFDDFHVVNDDARLRSLFEELQDAAREAKLSLLIISRQSPIFVKELVCPPLKGLNPADARQFIKQANLPDLSEELFEELYGKTGGNPQLLNLFVAWAMGQEDADSDLRRFVSAMPSARGVHHYLLHNVYNSLELQEQQVIKALALLRPPTEYPAIRAILGERETRGVGTVLDSLARKHIVEKRAGEGGVVFFHAIIREFCYTLVEESVRRDWHGRAAIHFDSVGNHVEAAYHHLNVGSHDRCAQILASQHQKLISQGKCRSLLDLLDKLDQTQLTPEQWLDICLAEGEALIHTAAYQEAIARFQAASRFPGLSEPQQAKILHKLSWTYEILGDVDQSLAYAQQGMSLFEDKTKHVPETGLLLNSLAWACYRRGVNRQAYELISQAIEVLEGSDKYARELGQCYRARGIIAMTLGDFEQAKADTRCGLQTSEQIGHTSGVAMSLNNLGYIATHENKPKQALEHYEQSLVLREQIGDTYGLSMSYHNVGESYFHLGDLARGREYLEKALILAAKMSMRQVIAATHGILAEIEIAEEDYQGALEHLDRALEIAEADGYRDCAADCYRGMAQVFLSTGEYTQALQNAQLSFQIAQEIDDPLRQARSNKTLGHVSLAQGQTAGARAHLQNALEIARSCEHEEMVKEVSVILADLESHQS